jgi:hypothetical protein
LKASISPELKKLSGHLAGIESDDQRVGFVAPKGVAMARMPGQTLLTIRRFILPKEGSTHLNGKPYLVSDCFALLDSEVAAKLSDARLNDQVDIIGVPSVVCFDADIGVTFYTQCTNARVFKPRVKPLAPVQSNLGLDLVSATGMLFEQRPIPVVVGVEEHTNQQKKEVGVAAAPTAPSAPIQSPQAGATTPIQNTSQAAGEFKPQVASAEDMETALQRFQKREPAHLVRSREILAQREAILAQREAEAKRAESMLSEEKLEEAGITADALL